MNKFFIFFSVTVSIILFLDCQKQHKPRNICFVLFDFSQLNNMSKVYCFVFVFKLNNSININTHSCGLLHYVDFPFRHYSFREYIIFNYNYNYV